MRAADLLGPPAKRPGIAGVAYDTAWLAGLPDTPERRSTRYPTTLRWLADNQLSDGSWAAACATSTTASCARLRRSPR